MAGYSVAARNARLDALNTVIGNGGKLAFYNGSRPATGGAATTKLAELVCGSPFAGAAAGAVLTANAITENVGLAAGTATWARLTTSAGVFVGDFSVGVGSGEIQLAGTAVIAIGQPVRVSSFAITAGDA